MAQQSTVKAGRPIVLAVVLSLLLLAVFPLFGCASPKDRGHTEGKLDIIATTFPPFDFARQAGGEHVQVTMLLPTGSESHTYEPTPKDVIRISSCDLFIYNGGVSDTWVDRLLNAAEIQPEKTVRMMDFVSLIKESDEGVLQGGDEHGHEAHLHEYDEHIWTDPLNAIRITEGIADRLVAIDPDHADDYRVNLEKVRADYQDLDRTFREVVQSGSRGEIIVADRFPLIYFTTAYGLDFTAAFPGCAAETDPKPGTVAAIIERVRKDQIPYIYHIEFSNEKLADLVADETGARKLLFHTAHNVSRQEIEEGATYLSIMRGNAERLRKGLGD